MEVVRTLAVGEQDTIHGLVLQYLRCTGRSDAVNAFEREAELQSESLSYQDSLEERGEIRKRILYGDIKGAIEMLNDIMPDLLDNNSELFFYLRLQAFAELVRTQDYDLNEALNFAAEEFVTCPPRLLSSLEEIMIALLFEQPEKSPLRSILGRREKVANMVNAAMLQYLDTSQSSLPKIMADAAWLGKHREICSELGSSALSLELEGEGVELFFEPMLN